MGDGTISFDLYGQALDPDQDLFLTVITRTAWIAFVVTLCCAVLGYAVAYAAVFLPGRLGVVLIGIICLPFFTSALVRTFGWQVILANKGPVNDVLIQLGVVDEPITLVYNDIGVVIGMTQVLLPMMVFPIYSAMRSIDRSLLVAAESLGSSPFRAWRTTFLPLSLPGVAAGSALVFVVALGYYTTPALLQGASTPLFSQRMDSLSGLPGRSGSVAAQATLVLLASLVLLALFRRQLGLVSSSRRALRTPRARQSDAWDQLSVGWGSTLGSRAGRRIGRIVDTIGRVGRWPLVAVLSLVALAMSIGPLVVVFIVGFSDGTFLVFPPEGYSTRWFSEYLDDPEWLDATATSLRVSIIAALITVVAGAGASFAVARSRRPLLATAAFATLVAPMVVPQIVLAIALLSLFISVGLHGTTVALVLGYVVISLPLAVLLLTSAFRGLDPLYERASSGLGASPFQTARWVLVPLLVPALTGALLFSFVTAFSDLVMAQFLGGPRAQMLERLMYQDIREEVSPEVAAVGSLLLVLVLLLALVATGIHSLTARRAKAASATPALRRSWSSSDDSSP